MKAPSALQHPGLPIEPPTALASHGGGWEGELAEVIGRAATNVSRSESLDYVLGYTCARDWQKRLAPALVTPETIPYPHALELHTALRPAPPPAGLTSRP